MNNIVDLRAEISRIVNVTLRGDFAKPEDRVYWQERVNQLSSRLSALEEEARVASRKAFLLPRGNRTKVKKDTP